MLDRAPERLKRAESIGAVAVDFTKDDPVQQNKSRINAMHPGEHRGPRNREPGPSEGVG